MEQFNLWPIPLLVDKIKLNPSWLSTAKKQKFEVYKDKTASGTTYPYDFLDKVPDLKSIVQDKINHYAYEVMKVKKEFTFPIQTSWVNKHIKGNWGGSHIHTNSMISGCVYLAQEKDSGNIVFERHWNYNNVFTSTLVPDYFERNDINASSFELNVEPGLIAIFPSTLQHYIQINQNKKERYSVAFNAFVRGKFGDAMNIVEV